MRKLFSTLCQFINVYDDIWAILVSMMLAVVWILAPDLLTSANSLAVLAGIVLVAVFGFMLITTFYTIIKFCKRQ